MQTIRVLKPFVFSRPAAPGTLNAVKEEPFTPRGGPHQNGVYDLEDDHPLLAHSWYTDTFCDGKVESPAQALERLNADAAKLAAVEAERVEQLAKAEIAARRQVVTSVDGGDPARVQTEVEANMNTPISELRNRQGADLVKTGPQLRSKQTGKKGAPAETAPETPPAETAA